MVSTGFSSSAAISVIVSAPSPATLKTPVTDPVTACWMTATTSVSQMKTNGDSEPRIFSSRLRSKSAVIWLSTDVAEDGADPQHDLLQRGA